MSIALIAPAGDMQSAIVIGSISAATRRASIKSFVQIAADHLANLKGVLDVEPESYQALLSDLLAFLKARGVAVDRS